MKFHKFISVILHPIVIPTVGVMLYFLVISNTYKSNQKLGILSLVFVVTYLIPLLILIIFKKLKMINTYQTESIRERKIPVALMIIVFYLLGNTLKHLPNFDDLALLFFSTSFGLFVLYLLFYFKIKASIHLLSFGISAGFFMVLSSIYQQSFLIIIVVILFVSGIVAAARLHLQAHTNREVYIGFFIGLLAPIMVYLIL